MEQIEIIKPDDWHVHFRDNEILKAVVPETTRDFARSIIMPNLTPPILNARQAISYKERRYGSTQISRFRNDLKLLVYLICSFLIYNTSNDKNT